MTRHLQREIERVKKKILSLSAMVEERLHMAVKSIADRNSELALRVRESDWEVDQMEVEVEEECLKILALHQPVAVDLRFLIAVLKINSDLERIGDLAVGIAKQSVFLAGRRQLDIEFDIPTMAAIAQGMVKESIDALVAMSPELAMEVCGRDDEIDRRHKAMYDIVQGGIREYPDQVETFIHMLSVSRHLERIADHATNIAEDVIYMVEGVITRHRMDSYVPETDEADAADSPSGSSTER
jgi:phosphate transport system protein